MKSRAFNWARTGTIFDINSSTLNKTATSLIDDVNINKKSCHPPSKFLLQTVWSMQPDWLKMDEVSLCLIIPGSKLWFHSRERARFYRKINCIPSAATHGACTKIFWNLINCTNFYDAEISWLLRLNVVMNKWMRERARKEKYYRQEEHDPELYRDILISKKMVQLPVLYHSTKQ